MMKTSLKKLRNFGIHRHAEGRDRRELRVQRSLAQLDELSRASQDMQDMKNCYDSLLSAAAATENSAYEFSESLREMGDCLLEKTALNDDEESGKVLLMLGKVQLELQKLVDNYRSHISKTITSPSESLVNELRIVEEMKTQCDEKRSLYEYMRARPQEKGRSRNSKGESFSFQQVQAALDAYDEEATLFIFRLKSLKQGQSRSLLTQAARHHAAQFFFFRKALKSLETVEPHVKLVTEQQHIDYQFSGLEDDDGDISNRDYSNDDDESSDDDEEENNGSFDGQDVGEPIFNYGENAQKKNIVSTLGDSIQENIDKNAAGDLSVFGRELKASSQSAPLFPEKKFDPAEMFRQMPPVIAPKFYSYVLPTPVETKSSISTLQDTRVSQTSSTSSTRTPNYRHSSPLEQKKYENILGNEKLREYIIPPNKPSVLRESNSNTNTSGLPPLVEELSLLQRDLHSSVAKKIKRQAFSGPLMAKSGPNKPGISASSSVLPKASPYPFSRPLLRAAVLEPTPLAKLPSTATTPNFSSSPKISELHELPRPPANSASRFSGIVSNQFGYSGPLISRRQETPAPNKLPSNAASPLPAPPIVVPRSFSIPSRGQRESESPVFMPPEPPQASKTPEETASPPLTPISFSNAQPASTAS